MVKEDNRAWEELAKLRKKQHDKFWQDVENIRTMDVKQSTIKMEPGSISLIITVNQ